MLKSTSNCTYGPASRSKLDLMGIRFVTDPVDDKPQPNDPTKTDAFTPPATQADLDKILETRLARERAATAEKFKDHDQFKAAAEELERVKNEKKTPDEKAIDEAKEAGRAEVRAVLASERVTAAFDKALEGRALNAAALLNFDRSKFVKGDSADTEAIKTWVEANSTEVVAEKPKTKDRGQGNRDTTAGGSVSAGRDLFDSRKKPAKS